MAAPKKTVTKAPAAEVKAPAAEVKAAAPAAEVQAPEVKEEAPKKATTAKKTATKKAAEPKKTAEPKAEAAPKKTAAAKKAAEPKKAPAKRTAAKKAEVETSVYVQYAGREVTVKELVAQAKSAYIAAGHKEEDIKTIDVYVKPEENAAYYVVNGSDGDKIDL